MLNFEIRELISSVEEVRFKKYSLEIKNKDIFNYFNKEKY